MISVYESFISNSGLMASVPISSILDLFSFLKRKNNHQLSSSDLNTFFETSYVSYTFFDSILKSLGSSEVQRFNKSSYFFSISDSVFTDLLNLHRVFSIYNSKQVTYTTRRLYPTFLNSKSDSSVHSSKTKESKTESSVFEKTSDSFRPLASGASVTKDGKSTVLIKNESGLINSLSAEISNLGGDAAKVSSIIGVGQDNQESIIWKYIDGDLQTPYQFSFAPANYKYLKVELLSNASEVRVLNLKPSLVTYEGNSSIPKTLLKSDKPIRSISILIPKSLESFVEYFEISHELEIDGGIYKVCSLNDKSSPLPELILLGPNTGLLKTVFIPDKEIYEFSISSTLSKKKNFKKEVLRKILKEENFENTSFSYYVQNLKDLEAGITFPSDVYADSLEAFVVNLANIGFEKYPSYLGLYTSDKKIRVPEAIYKNQDLLSNMKLVINGVELTYASSPSGVSSYSLSKDYILLDPLFYSNAPVYFYIEPFFSKAELKQSGLELKLPLACSISKEDGTLVVFEKKPSELKTHSFKMEDMASYGNGIKYYFLPSSNLAELNWVQGGGVFIADKTFVPQGLNLTDEGDWSYDLSQGLMLLKTSKKVGSFTFSYKANFDELSLSKPYTVLDSQTILLNDYNLDTYSEAIPLGSSSYQIQNYSPSQYVEGSIYIPGFFQTKALNLKRNESVYLERYSHSSGKTYFLIPYWPVNESHEMTLIDAASELPITTFSIDDYLLEVPDPSNSLDSILFSYVSYKGLESLKNTFTFNSSLGLVTFLQPTLSTLPIFFKTHNYVINQKLEIPLAFESLDDELNLVKLSSVSSFKAGDQILFKYKRLKNSRSSSLLFNEADLNISIKYIDVRMGYDGF